MAQLRDAGSNDMRGTILRNAANGRKRRAVNNVLLTKYVLEKETLSEEQVALVESELGKDKSLMSEYKSLEKAKCFLVGAETPFSEL